MNFFKEILDYKDVLEDNVLAAELEKPGHWIIAYVNPYIAWPVQVQKIAYGGLDYWIIPITKDAYPAVAVREISRNPKELREKISRFLSVLSWIENHGILIHSFGGGTHLTAHLKKGEKSHSSVNKLDLRYLPVVTDRKAMLALALMREGRGMQRSPYSFLSYWRVLEVTIGKTKIQTWINSAMDRLNDHWLKETIDEVRQIALKGFGEHFYVSGRCAVAHASEDPIADPDQPEDGWRLSRECPVIEALAVLAIEEKFGIKTSHSEYKEHLYELAGFKEIFGTELVARIISREELPIGAKVDFPNIDFGLWGRGGFKSLNDLKITRVMVVEGIVKVSLERSDRRVRIDFDLNFNDERLEFDIYNGIYAAHDDGSPEFAEIQADIKEFSKWYFLNGSLELRRTLTRVCVARKDAFIPINVVVRTEGFDSEIDHWRKVATSRRNQSVG